VNKQAQRTGLSRSRVPHALLADTDRKMLPKSSSTSDILVSILTSAYLSDTMIFSRHARAHCAIRMGLIAGLPTDTAAFRPGGSSATLLSAAVLFFLENSTDFIGYQVRESAAGFTNGNAQVCGLQLL